MHASVTKAHLCLPQKLLMQHAHQAVGVGWNCVKQAVKAGVTRGHVWSYSNQAAPNLQSLQRAGCMHIQGLSSHGTVSGAHAS